MPSPDCGTLQRAYAGLGTVERAAVDRRLANYAGGGTKPAEGNAGPKPWYLTRGAMYGAGALVLLWFLR